MVAARSEQPPKDYLKSEIDVLNANCEINDLNGGFKEVRLPTWNRSLGELPSRCNPFDNVIDRPVLQLVTNSLAL